MTRITQSISFAAICALMAAAPIAAYAYTGEHLAPEAKITIGQARTIALKAVPGQIADQELEKEGGGSGLRYSFDIKQGKTTYEVGIDAKTGAVLEHSIEGPNAD